jgi:peptidoglycan/xylan/chitin deacetylase (PgdA/CDA1 family)
MKRLSPLLTFLLILLPGTVKSQTQLTTITKWQDNKPAAVCITYDDASINQFKIAIPLMDERGIPGTFFIITGDIPGSRYQPKFIGRPMETIIRETATVPTGEANFYERLSLVRYLAEIAQIDSLRTFNVQSTADSYTRRTKEACAQVDSAFAKIRGRTLTPVPFQFRKDLTWDMLRQYAKKGHELANHTISHAYLPAMDQANMFYELDMCSEDIRRELGPKYTFSAECPFGTHDIRLLTLVYPKYPLYRNGMTENYIHVILRGVNEDPAASGKEYVQWQRGAVSASTMPEMKGWIDTSIKDTLWFVLVIHGIDGVGWEPLTTATVREYFDYIKSRENNLWIATFGDIGKYMRERVNGIVSSYAFGDVITVTVSHPLDRTVYDLPLTLRTTTPASWTGVTIAQGARKSSVPVIHDSGGSYVSYRAVPDGTPITLTRSAGGAKP